MLASDRTWVGGTLGILAVLHTWSRTLEYHPHAHLLVTAGGLSSDATAWIKPAHPRFLGPGYMLARIFRANSNARVTSSNSTPSARLPPPAPESAPRPATPRPLPRQRIQPCAAPCANEAPSLSSNVSNAREHHHDPARPRFVPCYLWTRPLTGLAHPAGLRPPLGTSRHHAHAASRHAPPTTLRPPSRR
jgi:hypothetical protein